MPYSFIEGKDWTIERLQYYSINNSIKKIVDVGVGAGIYAKLLKQYLRGVYFIGIEIWENYITQFGLDRLYDDLILADVRNIKGIKADVAIFGDVLEHMTKEEAQQVIKNFSTGIIPVRFIIISIPIVESIQGDCENPYEKHIKTDWSHEEVMSSFRNIIDFYKGETLGVYLIQNY